MAINRQKKNEILQDLMEKFKNAKSVVFAQYSGISVKDLTALRKELRKNNLDYKVAKKTLIKIAAEKNGWKELPENIMEGQVGVAFGYEDEVLAAKTVYSFTKKFERLQIKGGLMGGQYLDQKATIELAKIPSKMELLGKFIGMLRAPLNNFHGILQSPLSSFVRAVSQMKPKN